MYGTECNIESFYFKAKGAKALYHGELLAYQSFLLMHIGKTLVLKQILAACNTETKQI